MTTTKCAGRVCFRSSPENYEKEKSGVKLNTLRKIDHDDLRFTYLKNKQVNYITITNSETTDSFTRKITDYTEWNGWAIISWKDDSERPRLLDEVETVRQEALDEFCKMPMHTDHEILWMLFSKKLKALREVKK